MRDELGKVCAYVAPIVLLVSAAPYAAAQKDTPPPPQWSLVTVTQVKPEARQDWEAYQKEITAAYKKAGVPSRAVLQTVFGNVHEFISVAPIAKFAEMDGGGPLDRALGAEGAAKLRRRGAAYVTSQHRYGSLAIPDLAIRTKTSEPYPFAMVTNYTLAPGKAQEFNAYMKDEYIPMLKKAEVSNFWVNQTVFGGAGERVTVRLMKTLGEIDEGPVARRALGVEGAQKLAARAAGIIASIRIAIVRYRPDLSYEAAKPDQATAR
jgi:hypothetical protein